MAFAGGYGRREAHDPVGDPDLLRIEADQLRADHGVPDHIGDSDAGYVYLPAEILCGRYRADGDQGLIRKRRGSYGRSVSYGHQIVSDRGENGQSNQIKYHMGSMFTSVGDCGRGVMRPSRQ